MPTFRSYKEVTVNMATGRVSGASTMMGPVAQILRRVRKQTDDLRGLWFGLRQDFYATNKKLVFSETGPGKFKDLANSTKVWKTQRRGSAYPILVDSGRLMKSLTNINSNEAIQIVSKKSMTLGTQVPYAKPHQTGFNNVMTKTFVPARPPVDMTDRQRIQKWTNMAGIWAIRKGLKV